MQVVSEAVLRAGAKRRTGSLTPYKSTSPSFDIAFITPAVAFAGMQDTMDFGQWSSYVADHPSVLLVRVTPKQVESLWVKMARGAAMTQGIALPPIKHFAPGVARMRVLCGTSEVTPVHPFIVERRISETDAVHEGLHVLGAGCDRPALRQRHARGVLGEGARQARDGHDRSQGAAADLGRHGAVPAPAHALTPSRRTAHGAGETGARRRAVQRGFSASRSLSASEPNPATCVTVARDVASA